MVSSSRKRACLLAALAALAGVGLVTGCQGGSGSSMSADDYKKAAAGSAITPEQQAAMTAGINKEKAAEAARQAANPPRRPPGAPPAQ